MTKKLLLTQLLISLVITMKSQVPILNNGFENWSPATGFITELPNDWKNASLFEGVTKVTDVHTGSFALKLAVAPFFTGVGCAGITYNHTFSTMTVAPVNYTFWAKIHLSGTDKLYTVANLFLQPSSLIVNDVPYNNSYLTTANNSSVWTQISFAMMPNTSQPYDSVSLSFNFSPQLDTATYIIIDDINFTAAPAGISEITKENSIESAYPNPATNLETIIYLVNDKADVMLTINDISGRELATIINEQQHQGKYKAEIDLANYANGVYFAKLMINGKPNAQKIVVQH